VELAVEDSVPFRLEFGSVPVPVSNSPPPLLELELLQLASHNAAVAATTQDLENLAVFLFIAFLRVRDTEKLTQKI
jgi:hypothetical protein